MRRIWVLLIVLGIALVVAAPAQAGDDSTNTSLIDVVGTSSGQGYWMFDADGRIYNYGDAGFFNSAKDLPLNGPIVGATVTSTDQGYMLFAGDGGIFTYGDAPFLGSAGALPLNSPIVGGALVANNLGYYLFAADGGVFAYGTATFAGSMGGQALNEPMVGGALHPNGGYYLVAADGGIFAYGGAPFYGSAGSLPLNSPIIAMAVSPDGKGYYLFASDGGVFAYGEVPFLGSAAGSGVQFSGFAATPDVGGYWLVTPDGYLQTFGNAPHLGAPKPGAPRPPQNASLQLLGQFNEPIAMHPAPNGGMLLAERAGKVLLVDDDGESTELLDISSLTIPGGEGGLLGMAIAPNGKLYVNHTIANGDIRIAEYTPTATTVCTPSAGTQFCTKTFNLNSQRVLLEISQPFSNHNGGDLQVGPDGMLWIASGDGGSGGDPQGNGQDRSNLLGTILRIDPNPSGGQPYGIPSDNPYAASSGNPRKEIWAYGLRNPWRFSFDQSTDDLWIADVGQNKREEVNHVPSNTGGGYNFGWNRWEGSLAFTGADPGGTTFPVYEYDNANNRCSITGGFVYRGSDIPDLTGQYLFGDFCSGEIWGYSDAGGLNDLGLQVNSLASFGYDAQGELYALSLSGSVYKLVAS
ncbi:MAG: sorbosone dehydrogenase family protein [Acidimicrobiales bacterium]